jgi:membrane-bound lytic murein transglycosylase D
LTAVVLALVVFGCGASPSRSGSETKSEKTAKAPAPEGKLYTYHPPADLTRTARPATDSVSEHLNNLPPRSQTQQTHRSFLSRLSQDNPADPGDYSVPSGMTDDSASAVDDDIWRQFDLASEYYQMGVLANREGSWEEAQYYFEKALKTLAALDIESESPEDSVDVTVQTPEQVKYNTLLENIVADYKMTLRSLGQLSEDITPNALVERFNELEEQLEHDTVKLFNGGAVAQVQYDLPIVMNERVRSSLIYFQTRARGAFMRYLSRIKRYEWLYEENFAKYGVPRDLKYLSLVESGFNPNAYSWARAMGLWQFIASTGRLYGLQRNWWVDERKDPIKATDAACRFLRDLYQQFGDWELAMAAYNGGPGRVSRTTAKQGTRDFWKLRLRQQTMDYVPLIYAAAMICKDPARYGFGDVVYEPPIVWDTVTISKSLDLRGVAQVVGCSLEELKELNPELLKNSTPPKTRAYLLKIPKGKTEQFWAAYESINSPKETQYVRHDIKRGETIGTIAAKYGVSQYALLEANNMSRTSQIIAGKELIIPVPLDRFTSGGPVDRDRYLASNNVYEIQPGDNLWDIAKSFGTTVDAIRRINYLERGASIYVGEKLRIPTASSGRRKSPSPNPEISAPKPPALATLDQASKRSGAKESGGSNVDKHRVRSGDTIWDIARMYNTTTSSIRELNGLGRTGKIYPGQLLTIKRSDTAEFINHLVSAGETLGAIAKQYRTSVARILVTNGLSDPNSIRVGDNLKIYPE